MRVQGWQDLDFTGFSSLGHSPRFDVEFKPLRLAFNTELRLSEVGRHILHYLTLPTSHSLSDDVGAKVTHFNLSGNEELTDLAHVIHLISGTIQDGPRPAFPYTKRKRRVYGFLLAKLTGNGCT